MRSALASSSASISSQPFSAFAKPRNICESITPLFPLAPLSAPKDAAAATSPTVLPPLQAFISFTADCIVMDIFVPVSPSGTGNTFSESTYALFFSSRAAPVRNISLRSAPFIVVLFKSISSMHSPLKGMRP